MPDLKQALKDFVATSNSGKYADEKVLISKFPELKDYDIQALKDFVATSNSGKYKSEDELLSKFPEFNIKTTATPPPQPPTGPQRETPQPRNKVAEMLNQPKAVDKLKQVVPTSEVTSGTKKPIMQKEQEVEQIEQKKEKKENLQLEVGYIGAKQEAVDKNIDINQLFKEKSDNLAQYLSEDSKVEYDYLKRLDDSSKQVEELTARTQATGNPLTQSELQKAKFNKFKAQQELLKYEKERSSTYDAKIKETQAELEAARLENDTELVKELEQDVVKLEAAKGKYLKNPNEKIIEVYTQAKQDMDMFKIPGTTPMERLRNYALSLNNQIEEIDNKIKRDYPGEPLEEPSYTGGYKEATRSPILEDLWKRKMELIPKMQVASQVSLLNRLPNVKEEGFFSAASREIQREFLPKKFTEQNIKDMPTSDVGDIILKNQAISNVADAMVNQNALAATQDLAQPVEAYSPPWWGGLTGTAISIIPGMAIGNKATSLASLPSKLKTIKTLISIAGKSKAKTYAKFIVPTLEATKEGLKYETAGNFLSENLKDEANFASGFMGQLLVGPFGKVVSGKNMQSLVGWFFKERAPQAAAILTSAGNKMAAGVGESIQETGEAVGPLVQEYFQTGDWGQLKTNLTKQFGDMDANMELFVGSFVMGMAMGSGTGLGDSAMNKAKDIYASMPPEQKAQADKIVQEGFVKDLTDAEVQAKKEEIQEGAEPLAEDILTEEDKQKKTEAIEKLNNPASTVAEKVEAGRVLNDIKIKEHDAKITEMALEEVAGEEVVSEEAVVETPTEEVAVEETKEQAPIVETPIEQPQAKEEIVENKKADIERRRQDELKSRVVYDRFPTVEDGEFKIVGDPNNRVYRINENTGRPQELDKSNGLWSNTAMSPNLFNESTKRSGFEKSKNNINAKYDAELKALETPPSEVVSEEVITPKEEVGEVEEIEVYHGGKYDEKTGNVYVTEDKNQANEYTKGNDGDLIKYSIGKSKIASEDVFRQAIEEEGISIDEELKLYELIDDRFETALSEEERSKIFDNLKKKGFEAASFIDEDITGRNKLGVTNMVVFDAATLGKKSVEVKESKAYELLENGYKPIINGEIKDDFTEKNIGDYFKSNKRIEMVSPSNQQAMGVVSKGTKQTVPALMDVDSTTKAFDKLQNENSKEFSDVEDMIIESTQIVGKYNNKDLSKAYHKAKKDGSNPELVKAVEDLLSPTKQTTPSEEQAKEVVSEEAKQETPKKEVVKEQPKKESNQISEVGKMVKAPAKKKPLTKQEQEVIIKDRLLGRLSAYNKLSAFQQKTKGPSAEIVDIFATASKYGFTIKDANAQKPNRTKKYELFKDGKKVGKSQTKSDIPEATPEQVKVAEKLIDKDLVTMWNGDQTAPRLDANTYGISWQEIRQGEKDIKAGKTNSAPAKRLIQVLNQIESDGDVNMVVGSGGAAVKMGYRLSEARQAMKEIPELTDEDMEKINANLDTLAKEYEEWFASTLTEQEQNNILEENESRNQSEISENAEVRQGETNVSNEKDGTIEKGKEVTPKTSDARKARIGEQLKVAEENAKSLKAKLDKAQASLNKDREAMQQNMFQANQISLLNDVDAKAKKVSNIKRDYDAAKEEVKSLKEQFDSLLEGQTEMDMDGEKPKKTKPSKKEIQELSSIGVTNFNLPNLVEEVGEKRKIDELIDKLNSLKIDTKNTFNAFGLLPETWNASIDIIVSALKAGDKLSKAIQDAVKYIKSTEGSEDFNQEDFELFINQKLGDEKVVEPPKTPKQAEEYQEQKQKEIVSEVSEDKEPKKREKALLNRAFRGVTDTQMKEAIAKHDLEYYQESWSTAKKIALDFISDVGLDNALDAVRRGMVTGAPAAYVWSANIDEVGNQLAVATDPTEIKQLQEIQSSLLEEFGVQTKKGGQFISVLRDIYANSEFGYDTETQVKKYKETNGGVIPKEIEDKMRKLGKELEEVKKKLAEAEEKNKTEQEEEAVSNIKDSVGRQKAKEGYAIKIRTKQIADTIRKGKTSRPSIFMSSSPAAIVWDGALEAAALTVETVGATADAIASALKYLKDSDWYKGLTDKNKKEAEKSLTDYLDESFGKEIGVTITSTGIKIPHSLIRQYVSEGITDINDLVTAIREDLLQDNPEISDRQIRDAITNYGKTVNPNQEEVEKQIRELKFVGRILSALEDIEQKKRPLKSGQQRDKLNVEQRRLNKKLKEALKTLPIDAEAEQNQLKTSLDAIKSRLRNQIEELNKQIETKERAAKNNAIPYDEETNDLVKERDRLKEVVAEIFGDNNVSEEQKIERVKKALERSLRELEQKIKDKDLEIKQNPKVTSPEIEEIRARLAVLRAEFLAMQEEAGIPEKRKLQSAKDRTKKQIQKLEQKIKDKDFSKRKPRKLTSDSELDKLRAEKIRIQGEFDKLQYQNELRNRTLSQKIVDGLFELWNITRALRATAELSPVLLQGGLYTIGQSVTNPMMAIRSFNQLFIQGFSEKKHERWLNNLRAKEYYPRVKESKLAITETDAKLNAKEELFLSGWVNHIWDLIGRPLKLVGEKPYDFWKKLSPPKFFERATIAYLNNIRLEKYLQAEEMLRMQGIGYDGNEKQYKAVADVINTFTGRGSLGKLEMVSKPLSLVFFSPRMWSSTIQQTIALPYFYATAGKGTTEVGLKKIKPTVAQKMIMYDYMKYVALTGAILMLIKAQEDDDDEKGMKIETNSLSSDFGKIKYGNTRIDPWGGRIQNIVLISRIMSDSMISKGEVKQLGSSSYVSTKGDLLAQMATNKLAPSSAMVYKYLFSKVKKDKSTGEQYRVDKFGNELGGPLSMTTDNLYPIYWETIKEIHTEHPAVVAGFLDAIAFFGVGVNVQEPKKPKERK